MGLVLRILMWLISKVVNSVPSYKIKLFEVQSYMTPGFP